MYCTPTAEEIELSKLISKNYPSMKKIRLVNTGSEATMTAIRLARGITKKDKIIKFEGCYHGAHDSVLVKAGSGSAHNGISVSAGTIDDVSKNTLVVQYNNSEELEQVIKQNKDVAAVIVEPILANMGLILPEKNFLSGFIPKCCCAPPGEMRNPVTISSKISLTLFSCVIFRIS